MIDSQASPSTSSITRMSPSMFAKQPESTIAMISSTVMNPSGKLRDSSSLHHTTHGVQGGTTTVTLQTAFDGIATPVGSPRLGTTVTVIVPAKSSTTLQLAVHQPSSLVPNTPSSPAEHAYSKSPLLVTVAGI